MACVICTHEVDPFDPEVISLDVAPDRRHLPGLPESVYAHLDCVQQRALKHPDCVRPIVVIPQAPIIPPIPEPQQRPPVFSLQFDIDARQPPSVVLYGP